MLTSYNGTTISYDAIGNPKKWRNAQSFTWDGRKLTYFYTDDGMKGMYFGYTADGIRTYKSHYDHNTGNMYHVDYVLDGTKIVSERYTHEITNAAYTLYYFYDAAGSITGFEYNGTPYYFQKNVQGDIVRILNASGQVVTEYTYDAWGKVLSVTGTLASTVGQINPFRYRGYYYDSETGFYYLQTRYYDPEVGRFINADGIIGANGGIPGYNLFAYCNNNPVMGYDPSGQGWFDDAWDWVCDTAGDVWDWTCDTAAAVWDGAKTAYNAATTFFDNVVDDILAFDPFNDDESKVLQSHYFSCYKGVPVIRLPIGKNAFSFWAMFIGNDVNDNTVRHEYGHAVHFRMIGPLNYLLDVAIPSLIDYWGDTDYDEYYSHPQEYIADSLGGVTDRKAKNQKDPYPYAANARQNALKLWRFSRDPFTKAFFYVIEELM